MITVRKSTNNDLICLQLPVCRRQLRSKGFASNVFMRLNIMKESCAIAYDAVHGLIERGHHHPLYQREATVNRKFLNGWFFVHIASTFTVQMCLSHSFPMLTAKRNCAANKTLLSKFISIYI
ncbi:hypothetical protein Tcan_01616, partial [Toxocara canis]